MILRSLVCSAECRQTGQCARKGACPYARMFAPSALGRGPSGLADWPRPFVFRATHLDGRMFPPGSGFHFDVNLFDMQVPAAHAVTLAFAQFAEQGLGPGRGKADLMDVRLLDASQTPCRQLFDGVRFLCAEPTPVELSLQADPEPVRRVLVRFLTPTELKFGRQLASQPDFPILAARIGDRLSTLRALYGEGPLELDFCGFRQRAARVRMVRCAVEPVALMRRSSRTGQLHPIGGFIGEAEYEGPLEEFLPFLRAAKWTGVGRQTVWGKGELEVRAVRCDGGSPLC